MKLTDGKEEGDSIGIKYFHKESEHSSRNSIQNIEKSRLIEPAFCFILERILCFYDIHDYFHRFLHAFQSHIFIRSVEIDSSRENIRAGKSHVR